MKKKRKLQESFEKYFEYSLKKESWLVVRSGWGQTVRSGVEYPIEVGERVKPLEALGPRRESCGWKKNTTSTSTSKDEQSNNLCLIAQNSNSGTISEQDESSVVNSSDSSSNSDDFTTYDMLYGAYVEMHEELKKLAKTFTDRKRLILEHEKKICQLQEFIDELKLENEILDLIYANSSCDCFTKLNVIPTCENSTFLEK
ncbi:hypothetical protein Lal_00043321 [Lupinus albus]|nr:hypothetical protein Lal_00043321 [Lupinus albus]